MTKAGPSTPPPRSRFPALPPGWLARDRLHAQLAGGIEYPVTTVTGPPGSGKTVLLSGWAQHGAPPVAWLSVDHANTEPADTEPADTEPADTEPADTDRTGREPAGAEPAGREKARFWRRLTGAVRAVDAGLAVRLGARPRPAATGARLGRRDHEPLGPMSAPAMSPTVLIVDEVELLEPEGIRALGGLIADLPPRLRLILAGRHLSGLPVEEWRGRNRWGEIDPSDLRFTPAEAVALFTSPGSSPLPDDTARALADKTEGWAAGLRLADLMSPFFSDAAALLDGFTGEARLLVEYFNRELIEHRPAQQVRFLLATAALDLLTAEGCAAVTGRSDAAVLLETLRRQNVVLDQSDPAVPAYRYHRLFHEFLRHKLHTEAPAIARLSHLRAAAWCEGHGDDRSAVRHLIRSSSHPEAFARGLAGVAGVLDGRYLPGGASLAITDLPDGFVDLDPVRAYVVAAAHLAGLRPEEAAGRLRALERHGREHGDRTGLRARAELLRTFRAGLLGDAAGVLTHFARAADFDRSAHGSQTAPESAPPSDSARTPYDLDRVLWRHLRGLAAAAHVWQGEPDAARAALADDPYGHGPLDEVDRLNVEAGLAYHDGRLQNSRLLADEALAAGRRSTPAGSISTVNALRTLAAVLYERDDLDHSLARLREAQQLCVADSLADWRAALAGDEARLLMARGRAAQALDLLRQLRGAGYDHPLPVSVGDELDRVEIRCRLALGDLEGAARMVESPAATARAVETVARLDLAAGRPDRAAERLIADRQKARLGVDIERLLLLSRACLQLGDEARCDSALQRALDLGRPDRFLRVFADDGAELGDRLTRISARSADPFLAQVLARTTYRSPGSKAAPAGVLEPFTDRERELISYLPSHLSQHEIAGVMYISLNTVKTHTKAVYRKLGSSCRSEAVDAARAHGRL